ncbi:MAG: hypothetical protein HZT43_15275 [Exiguobacterium profundum]|nr:MAG: hypothetical protein HZT43_15275 [Exiguobacterium profundum]
MADELPTGRRFSQLYLRPEQPVAESKRLRARLVSLFKRYNPVPSGVLAEYLDDKLGTKLCLSGSGGSFLYWDRLEAAEFRDVLDSITLIGAFVRANAPRMLAEYKREINEVLAEEAAAYRIDSELGVHPAIDLAYEATYDSLVVGLGASGFSAARDHLTRADMELLPAGSNREAIRAAFDAVENIFKMIFRHEPSLREAAIKNSLLPIIDTLFQDDVEKRASRKMAAALQDWTDCCHNYRHEPGHPEQTPPCDDLSVLVVSQGMSFARWLASILERKNSTKE